MSKKKYRIIEELRGDGNTVYLIQKRARLFWIGPKIWKTYSLIDGYSSWEILKRHGKEYDTFSEAANKTKWLKTWEYEDEMEKRHKVILNSQIHNV